MNVSKFRMADSWVGSPGWEDFKRSAPITRAFNHLIAGMHFERVFHRWPRPPSDRASTINDFIFDRMVALEWSDLHKTFVDKETAKGAAKDLHPSILVPETVSVIAMDAMRSVSELSEALLPFIGAPAVAKPTHASGAATFLQTVGPLDDLQALYDLASQNYVSIMREMQYLDLPKKVIVETMVPAFGGTSLDDYKFHCVHGEPLVCQIDHGRFGKSWSRIFRVPDFEPMDQNDGLAQPIDYQLPDSERIVSMITAARALSAPFDFVRVDLYDGTDGIYFGELTFSPAASLGIAPSAEGDHAVNDTHRIYSEIMMSRLR